MKAAKWIESNWDFKSTARNMTQNLGLNYFAVRREIASLKRIAVFTTTKKSFWTHLSQSVQVAQISGSNQSLVLPMIK